MTTILHGVNHKQRDYEFAVVGQASSGRGLLELVKRVPADLAFVDISMPDMSGLDACLLYTSPSPRDRTRSRMPSSA